ncbi:MAG: NADAR family protein [Cellvibrionaceae bacterium]
MLSREDIADPLSSFSHHPFELEGMEWMTVEHYFQAMKFENENYREKVRLAKDPIAARKLGKARFKKIRKDWKTVDEIVMTRAVYTKARTYEEVAKALLDTGDKKIIEKSQYDYIWGCGRDGRGLNKYGNVLMNVRDKLLQEQAALKGSE